MRSDLMCFPGELLSAVITTQLSLGAVMLQVLRKITSQQFHHAAVRTWHHVIRAN